MFIMDNSLKTNFTPIWIIIGMMCFIQSSYILLAHFLQQSLQQTAMTAESREILRSIFYLIAIVTFPLTNLIRHIQLRLNQTVASNTPLNKRYLMTVMVSQIIMLSIGSLGFIIFILGDDFNSLYIFSFLAFLGFFLHQPKKDEYQNLKNNYHG